MREIKNEPTIDSATPAYDGALSEVYALGLGQNNKQIFRWLGTDERDIVDWGSNTEEIVMGPAIDDSATRANRMVVYDHTTRGYWELDTEIGGPDYDDVVFGPIVVLCRGLREKRLKMIFGKKGVKNG